jgi:hypothetical protein
MRFYHFWKYLKGQIKYKCFSPRLLRPMMFVPRFLVFTLKLIGNCPTLGPHTAFCPVNGLYLVRHRAFSTKGICGTDDLEIFLCVLLLKYSHHSNLFLQHIQTSPLTRKSMYFLYNAPCRPTPPQWLSICKPTLYRIPCPSRNYTRNGRKRFSGIIPTGQRLCAKHCPFLVVFDAQRPAVYTRLVLFWLIQGVAGINMDFRIHLQIPGNLRWWISLDLHFTVMLLQCLTVFCSSYIMSLVGLNITAHIYQRTNFTNGPPVSNFTLSPDKLDAAIAQTVAQLTWMGRESY